MAANKHKNIGRKSDPSIIDYNFKRDINFQPQVNMVPRRNTQGLQGSIYSSSGSQDVIIQNETD